MKLIIITIVLLALKTVNSFSFPSPTLFPIPEITTESTVAPPERESQKALHSALRQIRLTLLKNLQVIGTFTRYILFFQINVHFGIPGDIESKVKTRPVFDVKPKPVSPKPLNFDAIYYIRMKK